MEGYCLSVSGVGLRTSRQRKEGCEVRKPLRKNWNLYLPLITFILNVTCDVQNELVPFTMKLCTHLTYDSRKLKSRSDRSCWNVGPVSALCQQGEPADQSPCAGAVEALCPPPISEYKTYCFISTLQSSCIFLV